jgi:hypothetical protein
MDLSALFHSPQFQNRWLPLLLKDSQQVWLDPTKEDFQKIYTVAYAKAEVARAWITFLEKQDARVESLRKQINNPDKNYAI